MDDDIALDRGAVTQNGDHPQLEYLDVGRTALYLLFRTYFLLLYFISKKRRHACFVFSDCQLYMYDDDKARCVANRAHFVYRSDV